MFGAWGLVSRNTPASGTVWYAFDERGNVAQRVNGSGSVLSTDLYDGFGNVTRTGGPDVFGFGGQAGYYTDAETGLILCTNRHYDSQSGRFLSRDPLGYGGGINLYSYTQNNPVNWLDPFGTDPDQVVIQQDPGGSGNGSHLRIWVTDANNHTGTWYGYYPKDPGNYEGLPMGNAHGSSSSGSSSSGSSGSSGHFTGPGYLQAVDPPSVTQVQKGNDVKINITPAQAKAIRHEIGKPVKPYSFTSHNCSTWAADVLRPTFPDIPEGVNTPKRLFDILDPEGNGNIKK